MSLIQLHRVDFSIGGPLLLDGVDLSIEANERVCIVGRNGEGKSTLMKLIAGELHADDGEIRVQNGVVIARMAQEVPQDTSGTVFDVVSEGLGDLGRLLALDFNKGDLIFLAGCFAMGFYTPLVKLFHRREPMAVRSATATRSFVTGGCS